MTSALESASLEASRMPPGGLMVEQVPLFVSIGFDDNQSGVETTLQIFDKYQNPTRQPSSSATYDGTATRVSYFHTTNYNTFGVLTHVWEEAASKGHETANHTKHHSNGKYFSLQDWHDEVGAANTHLLNLNGINKIYGFRAPFLEYNDQLFNALTDSSYEYEYDCSISEGEDESGNGKNFHWPYTLDSGSHADPTIGAHPGLWELPVYILMVIPDAALENYGLSASNSLIQKLGATKITGFDYNLFQKGVSGPELAALLKYNLDLRLAGNRAPLLFGAHAANYPSEGHEYSVALSDFLAYATSKSAVRVVPFIEIVRWMENPQAFATNSKSAYRVEISVVPEEVVSGNPCEAEIWSSAKPYNEGNEVKYNGKLWRAKWWTQGNEPGSGDPWEDVGECETITLLYHGTTNPTGTLEVVEGEDFTLTILPDEGYAVDKIVVNGENFSGTTQLKLSSVLESKKIEVHFKMDSSWRSHAADNAISFDIWAQDQGLSGDKASDTDNDGISDYFEYFSGTDPKSFDAAILRPRFEELNINSELKKYFTVTFEVSTEASAEYRIEVSHALAEKTWQAGDDFFIFHSASPVNSGKSTIRWRSPLPLNDPASPSNTYLRLNIKDKTIQP